MERANAAPSGGIFISYRRQDASHLADRLYDRLADSFGEAQIFMDVDTIDLESASPTWRADARGTVIPSRVVGLSRQSPQLAS